MKKREPPKLIVTESHETVDPKTLCQWAKDYVHRILASDRERQEEAADVRPP